METRNSLQLKEVRKSFRRKEILHGISCDLENGVYGLLGTNGAGKTTLMRCMTGYYQYKGDIILNESNVRKMGLRKIGYLPQKFVGYPELSVYQMLEYFCNIKKLSRREWKDQIDQSLTYTNLEDKRDAKIRTLSGGMVRRVGIAQAILGDPQVILLDEPTTALDPASVDRLTKTIESLQIAKLIVSHDFAFLKRVCGRMVTIRDAQILALE